MIWKKTLSILLSCTLFAGVLGGCGAPQQAEPSASPEASQDAAPEPEQETPEEEAPNAPEDAETAQEPATESDLDEEKVLNIFTWDGYIPLDIIAEWEESTGVKINYSNFTSNEDMLTKLQANGGSEYDIVLASDYIIATAAAEGLLQELNKEQLSNYGNLNPSFLSKFYDPENKYTIPYGPGGPLLIYDPAVVDTDIQGFADLWNPALEDSVIMMSNMRVVIGTVLLANGYSMNSTDPAELAVAREKLLALKPNIYGLDDNNPQGALVSGEVPVGYTYTSQLVAALADQPDLQLVYPKEGIGFGIDAMFIPVNAPHANNANAFLNFILDGERSARIYEEIGYICPNAAATEFLSEEYKSNPALNIPDEMVAKAEFIEPLPNEALAEYDRIWTEFQQ